MAKISLKAQLELTEYKTAQLQTSKKVNKKRILEDGHSNPLSSKETAKVHKNSKEDQMCSVTVLSKIKTI